MRASTTLAFTALLLTTNAVAQPPMQPTGPRPPVIMGGSAPTASRVPEVRRQLERQRPQAARDVDPVYRQRAWVSAGAPPATAVVQRPTRLTATTPRAATGAYLAFVEPYEVIADSQDGFASFTQQYAYLAIFIPGSDTRGLALDCVVSGPATIAVGVSRLGPLESISRSDVTVQNGHVFIYIPPETSGRTRLVSLSTGGSTWWFFNCVTQPA